MAAGMTKQNDFQSGKQF